MSNNNKKIKIGSMMLMFLHQNILSLVPKEGYDGLLLCRRVWDQGMTWHGLKHSVHAKKKTFVCNPMSTDLLSILLDGLLLLYTKFKKILLYDYMTITIDSLHRGMGFLICTY